jgi:hypothetical protein
MRHAIAPRLHPLAQTAALTRLTRLPEEPPERLGVAAPLAAVWASSLALVGGGEYPTSFDPQDLDAELANAMKFASLKIPGLVTREAWAAITRAYLGSRVSPERLDELLNDLMSQPDAPASSLGF